MADTENRRSRMTRRLLREAMLELLTEKNITQISIKALCEQADMNRTTFYLHYSDQYALLDELIEEVYRDTVNYMQQVMSSGTQEYVAAFLNYMKSNADTFRTLLVSNPDTGLAEKLMVLSEHNINQFMPDLPDTPESRYIRTFVSEGSFRMLIAWIREDFSLPVDTLAKLAWQLPDYIYRGTSAHSSSSSGS